MEVVRGPMRSLSAWWRRRKRKKTNTTSQR
jgi:hypothetical protein